jgi:catechol 2,3-dioxygenase
MKPNPRTRPLHPRVGIGHVHLKVADLDRALGLYRDVLGFEVTQRYGTQAAFFSAGGYHHHIGLNTLGKSRRVTAPARYDWAVSFGNPVSDARRTR